MEDSPPVVISVLPPSITAIIRLITKLESTINQGTRNQAVQLRECRRRTFATRFIALPLPFFQGRYWSGGPSTAATRPERLPVRVLRRACAHPRPAAPGRWPKPSHLTPRELSWLFPR